MNRGAILGEVKAYKEATCSADCIGFIPQRLDKRKSPDRKTRKAISILGCLLLTFVFLFGCGSKTQEMYHAYYEYEPAESELATLNLGDAIYAIIDDKYIIEHEKYESVKLLAGDHRIKWANIFVVSVMIEPSGFASYEMTSNVTFEAGHTYEFKAARTHGPGYRVYLWIEDTATGKVIDGKKKP
jgi:hypothetical protein